MLISLDFDDTYTLDPYFWDRFIVSAKSRGHEVICVTSRKCGNTEDVITALADKVTIFCTSHRAKKDYLAEIGLFPDVWIDDKPKHILKDKKT